MIFMMLLFSTLAHAEVMQHTFEPYMEVNKKIFEVVRFETGDLSLKTNFSHTENKFEDIKLKLSVESTRNYTFNIVSSNHSCIAKETMKTSDFQTVKLNDVDVFIDNEQLIPQYNEPVVFSSGKKNSTMEHEVKITFSPIPDAMLAGNWKCKGEVVLLAEALG